MLDLSKRDRAFIIAEAGTCHAAPETNDRLRNAKRYVLAAADAGADCIKFQMFDNTDLFCPYEGDEQRKPRWLDSELSLNGWRQVKEFAEACGMVFLASVFQNSMFEMLRVLGVETVKVASRAAEKFSYKSGWQFFVSTGMFVPPLLNCDYRLFECESKYPSTKYWSGDHEGFSDHSGAPDRAMDAISRGCKLIEVHFYIDRIDAGPDLQASLNLEQLKLVCKARDGFVELRSDE